MKQAIVSVVLGAACFGIVAALISAKAGEGEVLGYLAVHDSGSRLLCRLLLAEAPFARRLLHHADAATLRAGGSCSGGGNHQPREFNRRTRGGDDL